MDAQNRLIDAALALIEDVGETAFSTRAACARAGVTAPTLYHHFNDADGLVSAAVMRGFEQFLARKIARPEASDAAEDLLQGWDDYVAFARDRPRLYAAMTARVLQGGRIAAAEIARAHLVAKLDRLQAEGRLQLSVADAADLVWTTAHAAALLFVANAPNAASPAAVSALRTSAQTVLRPTRPPSKIGADT